MPNMNHLLIVLMTLSAAFGAQAQAEAPAPTTSPTLEKGFYVVPDKMMGKAERTTFSYLGKSCALYPNDVVEVLSLLSTGEALVRKTSQSESGFIYDEQDTTQCMVDDVISLKSYKLVPVPEEVLKEIQTESNSLRARERTLEDLEAQKQQELKDILASEGTSKEVYKVLREESAGINIDAVFLAKNICALPAGAVVKFLGVTSNYEHVIVRVTNYGKLTTTTPLLDCVADEIIYLSTVTSVSDADEQVAKAKILREKRLKEDKSAAERATEREQEIEALVGKPKE